MRQHNGRVAAAVVLMFAGVLLAMRAQGGQAIAPEPPAARFETLLTVEQCESLADELSGLPAWSESSPNTSREWAALASFARKMQDLPPSDVRSVLFVYMTKYKGNDYSAAVRAATRPMLVLRLMFDIPPDAPISIAMAEGEPLSDLLRTAGRIPNEDGTDATISAPLTWREGKPHVVGVPRDAMPPQTINAQLVQYQPQKEYEFFRAKYRMRGNLSDLSRSLRNDAD